MHLSLTDRIRTAETPREIDALLSEGANWTEASDRTRNKWKRVAEKRRKQVAA